MKFVTNLKQTLSDFRQCQIRSVHEEQIVMKAPVKKTQLLRVAVTVKVRRACSRSHYDVSCLPIQC